VALHIHGELGGGCYWNVRNSVHSEGVDLVPVRSTVPGCGHAGRKRDRLVNFSTVG
jgi:NADH:ubiquinone oxidoreductase subunit B-like Fe-S oxidoreductase